MQIDSIKLVIKNENDQSNDDNNHQCDDGHVRIGGNVPQKNDTGQTSSSIETVQSKQEKQSIVPFDCNILIENVFLDETGALCYLINLPHLNHKSVADFDFETFSQSTLNNNDNFENYLEYIFQTSAFNYDLGKLVNYLQYRCFTLAEFQLFINALLKNYFDTNCLTEYLCLLQQLKRTPKKEIDHLDRLEIRKRLDKFCKNLIKDHEYIIFEFLPLLQKDVFYYQEPSLIVNAPNVDNFEHSLSQCEHLNIMSTLFNLNEQMELSINKQELIDIIDWLYPNYDLYRLFLVIERIRKSLAEDLLNFFNEFNYDTIRNVFYTSPIDHKFPLTEQLVISILHDSALVHRTCNNKNEDNNDDNKLHPVKSTNFTDCLNKSIVVFCLRATLFNYLQKYYQQWLTKKDDEFSKIFSNIFAQSNDEKRATEPDDQLNGSSIKISNIKLACPYLIEPLYQYAINLGLIAAALSRDDLVNQLLTLQIADLKFETNLRQASSPIQTEFEFLENHLREEIPSEIFSSFDTLNRQSFDDQNEIKVNDSGKESKQLLIRKIRQLMEKMSNHYLFPTDNNKWEYGECIICYEFKWIFQRSCCSTNTCLDCLAQYYTNQIKMGIVSIECIGPNCRALVYRKEVTDRLSPDVKALFTRLLLAQSDESAFIKPCLQCNKLLTLSSEQQRKMKTGNRNLLMKRILLFGHKQSLINQSKVFKVNCEACGFVWCFKCHSPWHEGFSCNDYVKGDRLLKSWAKNQNRITGDINAQKCPKCKIYIQRINGCDHMHCARCKTNFCYRCGDTIQQIRFFGDHYSRLSVLGCKYRYKPKNPVQRKLVRGAVLGSKLLVLPVITTVCLCTGALVLTAGLVVLPFAAGVYFCNRMHNRTAHQRLNRFIQR